MSSGYPAGHVGGAVVTAPALLGVAGFNSAGIAAGSCAAGMMSSAAASNGGEVTAGGVVAVLQSDLWLTSSSGSAVPNPRSVSPLVPGHES
uniref:Uncharacterized protein n=1 Tax=Maylandia zebra TaxID=106582 RepID=A0A3P9DFM5_9CICH